MAKENLLLTPAIVSLTNLSAYLNVATSIQGSHLIGLSVSFFSIDQSECLVCYFFALN